MENENKQNDRRNEIVFSKKFRAGKRRTYFFDVKATRANDYYLTITESKKRHDGEGYDRHKVFLYKEDFNKFLEALNDAVNHIKSELMPEYDFDEFSHKHDEYHEKEEHHHDVPPEASPSPAEEKKDTPNDDDMKW